MALSLGVCVIETGCGEGVPPSFRQWGAAGLVSGDGVHMTLASASTPTLCTWTLSPATQQSSTAVCCAVSW